MAAWTAFGAVVGVVLTLLLLLSWLTQRGMDAGAAAPDDATGAERSETPPLEPAAVPRTPRAEESAGEERPSQAVDDAAEAVEAVDAEAVDRTHRERPDSEPNASRSVPEGSPAATTLTEETTLSGGALLANVAASQGAFAIVLVLAAVATGVPAAALGASPEAFGVGPLAAGVALGLALTAANQAAVHLFRRLDVAFSEDLRSLLAPASLGGWAALLLGVLPLVAVFEELLFRAILIGAFATGFGIDPWLLVVLSSGLFAAGHGAQGVGGVVVTGTLGLILGTAFVLTGSLAAVVVAHYLVNAMEFLLHER